ncbi:PDZ domain-containing protein [Catenulispora yoronensis]|uniref:endopeptidase La n=1 Tax=Catenulispora yoronensis TaxID=450799 RepID=A0ABP5GPA9_9ACTN
MQRRALTLTLSGATVALLTASAFLIPTPYAEMSPGPTYDTLGSYSTESGQPEKPVIAITGTDTFKHDKGGQLRMVTVEVSRADYHPNSVEVLSGWLSDDKIVVPRTVIYPEGQTAEQATQQNTALFDDSEDQAITAALAAKNIKPVKTEVVVDSVTAGSPADGKLQPKDVITAVDGTALAKPDDVHTLIQKHKPGETVALTITRDGKQQDVSIVTAQSHDTGPSRALVGFVPRTQNVFPFDVKIQLDNVGGPSAGMMFALGIIDELSQEDITGGLKIAGTGTIDADGKVGPIGGVQMKTLAAKRDNASVFLTPADNCADAVKNAPSGMKLVKVTTLQSALDALNTLRAGGTPTLCG